MTLSRDEIMAMTAEELRVAIARKKGYLFIQYPEMVYVVSQFLTGLLPRGGNRIEEIPEGVKIAFRCPDYPHDIAAAWELVEDWHKKEEVESIDFVSSYIPDENGIHSMVYSCYLRHSHITAEAPTAPLAISRAWLIWSEESGK